jgi:hypothetical protein
MHLTLAQSVSFTATAGAAWLMVRAGTAKGALKVKARRLCPACGRRRDQNGCLCTRNR